MQLHIVMQSHTVKEWGQRMLRHMESRDWELFTEPVAINALQSSETLKSNAQRASKNGFPLAEELHTKTSTATCSASAYHDIVHNFMLPFFRENFWNGLSVPK